MDVAAHSRNAGRLGNERVNNFHSDSLAGEGGIGYVGGIMKNTKLLSSLECPARKQPLNKPGWDHFFLNLHPVSEDFMRTAPPVSPGEMLEEEFLKPLGLTKYRLAKDIGVPPQRISDIVLGKRSVTADTDLRLCKYFGLSDGWWLRGQASYDSAVTRQVIQEELERIQPCKLLAA